jgi:hypothetical protein
MKPKATHQVESQAQGFSQAKSKLNSNQQMEEWSL